MQATGLPFCEVPGLPSSQPSTSIKLPGVQGLRVDILAPGTQLGQVVQIPELTWAAQAVPYYDYLLADPEPAALLAGGQCIPLRLPQAARMVWHKLYAASKRQRFPEKAAKDRQQAATLAAALAEHEAESLTTAFAAAPQELKTAAAAQWGIIDKLLAGHAEARAIMARSIA
jgi:hypothetical protein